MISTIIEVALALCVIPLVLQGLNALFDSYLRPLLLPELITIILVIHTYDVIAENPSAHPILVTLLFVIIGITYLIINRYQKVIPDNSGSIQLLKNIPKYPQMKFLSLILIILYLVIGVASYETNNYEQVNYKAMITAHDLGTFKNNDSDKTEPDNESEFDQDQAYEDNKTDTWGHVITYFKISKHSIQGYDSQHQLIMNYKVTSTHYEPDNHGLLVYGKYTLAKQGVTTNGKNVSTGHQESYDPTDAGVVLGYKNHKAFISTQGNKDNESNQQVHSMHGGTRTDTDTDYNTPYGGEDDQEPYYAYELKRI